MESTPIANHQNYRTRDLLGRRPSNTLLRRGHVCLVDEMNVTANAAADMAHHLAKVISAYTQASGELLLANDRIRAQEHEIRVERALRYRGGKQAGTSQEGARMKGTTRTADLFDDELHRRIVPLDLPREPAAAKEPPGVILVCARGERGESR